MVQGWQMKFVNRKLSMEIQEGNATQTSAMLLAPKTAWPKAQTLASSSNVSSAVVELAQVAMNLAQRYPVTLKKGQLEWLVDPFDSRFMNVHRKMCYIMLQLCIDACTSVYGYAPLYTLDKCHMRMTHISMYAVANMRAYMYVHTHVFLFMV